MVLCTSVHSLGTSIMCDVETWPADGRYLQVQILRLRTEASLDLPCFTDSLVNICDMAGVHNWRDNMQHHVWSRGTHYSAVDI